MNKKFLNIKNSVFVRKTEDKLHVLDLEDSADVVIISGQLLVSLFEIIVSSSRKDVNSLFLDKWKKEYREVDLNKILAAFEFKSGGYHLNLNFGILQVKSKLKSGISSTEKINLQDFNTAFASTDLSVIQVEACIPYDGGNNWPCDILPPGYNDF